MRRSTVEDILLRAREERLARVTAAELTAAARPERYEPHTYSSKPGDLSQETRAAIARAARMGVPRTEVARRFGVSERTVLRWEKRLGASDV